MGLLNLLLCCFAREPRNLVAILPDGDHGSVAVEHVGRDRGESRTDEIVYDVDHTERELLARSLDHLGATESNSDGVDEVLDLDHEPALIQLLHTDAELQRERRATLPIAADLIQSQVCPDIELVDSEGGLCGPAIGNIVFHERTLHA